MPWPETIHAAELLRAELKRRGLACWVKLTGGKGLHLVVPFQPEHGWPTVYEFSRTLAESVARHAPEKFTLDFAKAGRETKILIDCKRNHRAAVAIAAYSARATPNGTLSVPVAWRELKPSLSPQQFTVQNIRARLKRQKRDPWEDYWVCDQRLEPTTPRTVV